MTTNWSVPTDIADTALAEWGGEIVDDVVSALQATAPKRTGQFADSIEGDAVEDGVEVTSSVIGRFLVEGTQAHPIDAHGNYSLHSPETGEYFGPHVEHPGTGPDPFVENAIDAGEAAWADALGDAIAGAWSEA